MNSFLGQPLAKAVFETEKMGREKEIKYPAMSGLKNKWGFMLSLEVSRVVQ